MISILLRLRQIPTAYYTKFRPEKAARRDKATRIRFSAYNSHLWYNVPVAARPVPSEPRGAGADKSKKNGMARTKYGHSAYWYAYHYGWTYSEARSLSGQYLDMHSYRPRPSDRPRGEWTAEEWRRWRDSGKELDSQFNPLFFGVLIACDIGIALRDQARALADPAERDRIRRELMRDLRRIRRPLYYARETERRRRLAEERRKVTRRTTTAPMPAPGALLAAWNARKSSREAMIRLGGLLDDLAAHVDSRLRFDENGNVVGRNGGIRGWLRECLPELAPKYKTLMRYKALATRLRQATGTKDPTPTSAILDVPRREPVESLLADPEPVFSRLFAAVDRMVSPEAVLLDDPKTAKGKNRMPKKKSARAGRKAASRKTAVRRL